MFQAMEGHIDHRLLVNYAADPDVIAPLLPPTLRPQVVRERAVVGVCILRLSQLRPTGLPTWAGLRSDNAAHRIAVEWDGPDGLATGVYVLRRDSGQRLPVRLGGRLFPGVHGRAEFAVQDDGPSLHAAYRTEDGLVVDATARPLESWTSRLFLTADEASRFFEHGTCGFSPDRRGGLEGVEMVACTWRADPVAVEAHCSFFEDGLTFPPGSIELDGALLLRDVDVEWHRVEVPASPTMTLAR